jgi:hypothetical protein
MKVAAFEGVVDHGRIRLTPEVSLPEKTRVYVVVPVERRGTPRILSPRLVHPEQASDFEKEIIEDPDADV